MEKAMMEGFCKVLRDRHLVKEGDGVLVGLSGGPDSLCLFHFFLQLRLEWDLKLGVVHVNHKLRPEVCDWEQQQVEKWCSQYEVPCYSKVIDCNFLAQSQGLTSEEAGRNARYEAYREGAARHRKTYGEELPIKVALAHHREDQAETVMMRILRGTGPDGLAGMDYLRKEWENLWVIRPLLDFSKEELVLYLKTKGWIPHEDATNRQPIYQRNRIRLELIPRLEKEYNPNIVDALCRLAEGAREDRDALGELAEQGMEKARKNWEVYIRNQLLKLPASIRKRVYIKILNQMGLNQDYTLAHLNAIDCLLIQNRTGSRLDLPKGVSCQLGYGEIRFFSEQEKVLRKEDAENRYPAPETIFSQMKLPCGACVRTRRPGDYLVLSGGGRKRLQDYYVDEKIPKDIRQYLPVVARNQQILAVLGRDILEEMVSATLPEGWPKRTRMGGGYLIKFEGGHWTIEQIG